MKICVSGASGLVGAAFSKLAIEAGHEVVPMVRSKQKDGIFWNADSGEIDRAGLSEADAVIHLAAESIADGRWNAAKKSRIHDSREKGTQLIADTLGSLENGPRILVCASAIGYYGDRGDELLTEDASSGSTFLAKVCRAWESACQAASDGGVRTVNLRIGIVLSKDGGALQKMLLPFKLGGGGIVGSGKQYWSWISIDDLAGIILHAIDSSDLSGPVNAVAPDAPTNYSFTKALGKVLKRPTLIPLPAFAAKLILGEMATELLLSSTRVKPAKLEASGYEFQHPELTQALRNVLK